MCCLCGFVQFSAPDYFLSRSIPSYHQLIMSQTYTVISPTDASLKPPQGNIPDFQDPFSIQPYWIETAALGLIAVSIVLGLRIYIKIAIVKKCRWEDCKLETRHCAQVSRLTLLLDTAVLGFVSAYRKLSLGYRTQNSSSPDVFCRMGFADIRSSKKRERRSPPVEPYRERGLTATSGS